MMTRTDAARLLGQMTAATAGALVMAGALSACTGASDFPTPRAQSAPIPPPSLPAALATTGITTAPEAAPAAARFADPCLPGLTGAREQVAIRACSAPGRLHISDAPFNAASAPVILDPLAPRTTWPLRGA